ncbi:hypothetical protein Leryth_012116, partial [Lithospermum erythrorhizon]
VSVPCGTVMNIVTVRCGHCSNLSLPIQEFQKQSTNIAAMLEPVDEGIPEKQLTEARDENSDTEDLGLQEEDLGVYESAGHEFQDSNISQMLLLNAVAFSVLRGGKKVRLSFPECAQKGSGGDGMEDGEESRVNMDLKVSGKARPEKRHANGGSHETASEIRKGGRSYGSARRIGKKINLRVET